MKMGLMEVPAELGELLAEKLGKPAEKKMEPGTAVEIMRLEAGRFDPRLPTRFKVNDLVTPITSGPYGDAGQPHLVVETRERTEIGLELDPTDFSPANGLKLDVRVLSVRPDGHVLAYWMDSVYLEKYEA